MVVWLSHLHENVQRTTLNKEVVTGRLACSHKTCGCDASTLTNKGAERGRQRWMRLLGLQLVSRRRGEQIHMQKLATHALARPVARNVHLAESCLAVRREGGGVWDALQARSWPGLVVVKVQTAPELASLAAA
jgi:hypothetical protein